jgi:hypothetical protein
MPTGDTLFAHRYFPLLRPSVHYLPTTIEKFGENLAYLRSNDEQAKRMAHGARRVMSTLANDEAAVQYLILILRRMQVRMA